MKFIEYVYLVFLLGSIVLMYFAVKHYYVTKQLIDNGVKTKAKVIDLIEISGDDGYTYKPVFEYTDRTETKITFKSDVSSSPPAYRVGDLVSIIYSKKSDERKVVSFWGLYRWTIILLCFAAPLFIIGGGYFLYVSN